MRMKKILICGLLTGMVSGICACSGQAEKEETTAGEAAEKNLFLGGAVAALARRRLRMIRRIGRMRRKTRKKVRKILFRKPRTVQWRRELMLWGLRPM
jgi:hypothetical protein